MKNRLRECLCVSLAKQNVLFFSGVDGKNFRDQEMSKAEISDEESGLDSCLSRPSHEIMV